MRSCWPPQTHLLVLLKMSKQEVYAYTEQRITKFHARESVKQAEILQRLTEQFSDQTLSRLRVFAWHKAFKEHCGLVENERHNHQARTSIMEENMQAICDLLEDDRCLFQKLFVRLD